MTDADDDGEADRDMKILASHAAQLAEHFESVQIIVTKNTEEGDGTVLAHQGAGNWFARYGSVREWLIKTDTRSRREVLREDDDE